MTALNTRSENCALFKIALPISLQCLFQSSFSIIDQLMVGQLGTNAIAAIGIGARLPSIFIFTINAVMATASIMIAQYFGKKDSKGVSKSFYTCFSFALVVLAIFFSLSLIFAEPIINFFTDDTAIIPMSASYLRIIAFSYIPTTVSGMFAAVLRNNGKANYPMISGFCAVVVNTSLNYVLIFGNFGAPQMGLTGAAIASSASAFADMIIIFFLFLFSQKTSGVKLQSPAFVEKAFIKKAALIVMPLLLNEFLWSFGETMFQFIYSHIGTSEMAAMTMTGPLQGMTVGLFKGISVAASVMVGNKLGGDDYEGAYKLSCKLMKISIVGSLFIGGVLAALSGVYVSFFNVDSHTSETTIKLICIFAGFLFIKVSNMVLSGGIIRSGGKTTYSLMLDILGTWVVGMPLGFISAFVFNLPIEGVYTLITIEEAVRLTVGFIIFKRRKWMANITKEEQIDEQ